jgi:hypothetical protein
LVTRDQGTVRESASRDSRQASGAISVPRANALHALVNPHPARPVLGSTPSLCFARCSSAPHVLRRCRRWTAGRPRVPAIVHHRAMAAGHGWPTDALWPWPLSFRCRSRARHGCARDRAAFNLTCHPGFSPFTRQDDRLAKDRRR